jgi:methyl-accepting chemotaxis protein
VTTASPSSPSSTELSSELSADEKSRLMRALETAELAAGEAERGIEAAGVAAARQTGDLEALQDSAQRLLVRNRDVRSSLQPVRDGLERAKITALNAGLEGARLGEPIGKVLVSVADELRTLLARSIDTLDEHANLLMEVERDRERWVAGLKPVLEGARALSVDLSSIQTQHRSSTAALTALGSELRRAIGGDPEAMAMIAEASQLAEGLARILATIAEKRPEQLSTDALGRLLEPLLSLARPGTAQKPQSGP